MPEAYHTLIEMFGPIFSNRIWHRAQVLWVARCWHTANGQWLQFDANGPFAGASIALDGSWAYQLHMPLL